MDVVSLSRIFRWIHLGAAGAWLGEVIVVVFVLVPILVRATGERRGWFLATVFPRIFRLASVLSLTVLIAGAGLWLTMNNWQLNLERMFTERWGIAIFVGGVFGTALTAFHFVAESKLEPLALAAGSGEIDDDVIVRRLRIIPRVGLAVLVIAFGSMMYAARGF